MTQNNFSIKFCIAVSLSFFFISASGQSFDTLAFSQHLKKEKLISEQALFNHQLRSIYHNKPKQLDSLQLELSNMYFMSGAYDSSSYVVDRISEHPQFSFASSSNYISILLVQNKFLLANEQLNGLKDGIFKNDTKVCLQIKLENFSGVINKDSVSPSIFKIAERYKNPPHYSPFLAGTLSTVVPGLGKLYLGDKLQALTAFLTSAFQGAVVYESYAKAGIKSGRFIISASIFTIFYSGNIYGSIKRAKRKKVDFYNQIDHEISNIYTSYIAECNK